MDRVDRSHRRSIRLRGYDYAQAGVYFVTICTSDRACLFGEVTEGVMVANEVGRVVEAAWCGSSMVRHEIFIDEFVVMPNHVHGIVVINAGAYGHLMMQHISLRSAADSGLDIG